MRFQRVLAHVNTGKAAWHIISTVSFVIAVTVDIIGDGVVLFEPCKPVVGFEFQLCRLGIGEASFPAQPVFVSAKGR